MISKFFNKKTFFNIIILLVSSGIFLSVLFYTNKPSEIWKALVSAEEKWLYCAIFCMILYWFFESISLYFISNKMDKNFTVMDSVKTSMIGQFFNSITPFSSGGQPAQAFFMVKSGMNVGTATSALIIKFIIYQSILTLYSLVVIIFKFNFFVKNISGFSYIIFIGFITNLVVVICLILIGFKPAFTKKSIDFFVKIISKIRPHKNFEVLEKRIDDEFDNFYSGFKFLRSNVNILLKTTAVIVLQLTAIFLIPYFVIRSIGMVNGNISTVVASSAFVLMVSSFVPLPGASGGAEGSFYLFFGKFVPSASSMGIVILIWRLITFYMTMIAGFLFTGFLNTNKLKLKAKKIKV